MPFQGTSSVGFYKGGARSSLALGCGLPGPSALLAPVAQYAETQCPYYPSTLAFKTGLGATALRFERRLQAGQQLRVLVRKYGAQIQLQCTAREHPDDRRRAFVSMSVASQLNCV